LVVAIATAIFRNAGPLLLGCIFALFPLYMRIFWKDVVSTATTTKQRALERASFALQINLSVQWAAIAICVATPVMLSGISVLLWFTYMKR
jgi:hypothetical protein